MNTDRKGLWYESNWVLLISNLLIPPLGLVLLGNSRHVSMLWKCIVAFIATVCMGCLIWQLSFVPSVENRQFQLTESPMVYSNITLDTPPEITSLYGVTAKPLKDEVFLKVSFNVTNTSEMEYFYVALLDQPFISNVTGEKILPDATISGDPFGTIQPNETKSGFFIFRVSLHFDVQSFTIQGNSFFISNNVFEKKRNAS
ncbi:MAG TPA: hypothetical protein PLV00_04455 [Caldisericia bacterium]|nr:hypothetical protein [Caldisericia bacterium]